MPHVDINGRSIYYELHGEGEETLTLLNGLTMSTIGWTPQIADFSKNFRLLLLDMCGQGKSARPDEGIYPLIRQADDIAALLNHLGIARTHLLGISYGGVVAQHFVVRHREKVNKLVLTDTLACGDEATSAFWDSMVLAQEAGGPKLRFRVMLPMTFGSPFLKAAAAMIPAFEQADGLIPWPVVKALSEALNGFDMREQHKTFDVETLVMVGEMDRFTPYYQAKMIAEGIPGAKFRVLPGVGHAPTFENPPLFNQTVLSFLQGTMTG
ncbi:MAG: alpha/beta fold hydrolase [Betaproteobacteria bacterium]